MIPTADDRRIQAALDVLYDSDLITDEQRERPDDTVLAMAWDSYLDAHEAT